MYELYAEHLDIRIATLFLNNNYYAYSQYILQDFPLTESIEDTERFEQLFNSKVYGQMLRLTPIQWTDRSADDEHACTRLEVHGCPLLGMDIQHVSDAPPLQNIQ